MRPSSLLVILALSLLGIAWQVKKDRPDWCTADFPVFYAGGQLAGSTQIYSADAVQAIHTREAGCTVPSSVFVRPPYYAALLWPLGRLSFHTAWIVWLVLSFAALVAFLLLWPDQNRDSLALMFLAMAWSYPIGYNFANGKDLPFVLIWIGLSAALLKQKRYTAAGLALAMCSLKFHLFLFIPLWIVCAKLWRVARGLVIGGAILTAISFLSAGPTWPSVYLAVLRDPAIDPGGPGGPQRALIRLLTSAFGSEVLWESILGILVVAVVWLIARRAPVLVGLAAALIGGLLINRHVAPSDLALLIPAGFAIVYHVKAEWSPPLVIAVLSPFPYLGNYFLPAALLEVALLGALAWHYRKAAVITPASCGTA